MIANALRDSHRGQTLVHAKRRHLIEGIEHHGSYVLVRTHHTKRLPLILPLDAEVVIEP